MDEILSNTLREWKVHITEKQIEKLNLFANLINSKNEIINLVSRKDISNLWERHIIDSLAFCPLIEKINLPKTSLSIADIGAGGGFPSIPLACVVENYTFSLFESSLRKYEFLLWAVSQLKLSNVSVFRKRVEKGDTGDFDVCIERAAGEPDEMIPLCLNLCHHHGYVVIWQYIRNYTKIEKTSPPYFIYNYSIGQEKDKSLFVFRRN